MKMLLWIVQIVLAFLYLAGGSFKAMNPNDVAAVTPAILPGLWRLIGVFEVIGAILLIAPAVARSASRWTPLVAGLLACETFMLAAVFASYSLEIAATNPLVFALPMGIMAVVVAYGRSAKGIRDRGDVDRSQ
jgi:hypothetical protein